MLYKSKPVLWTAAATVLILGVFRGTFLHMGRQGRDTDKPANAGAAHFQERALESGITFRMQFLPNEQGETFKINLYDHGSGVAVGDYDGDGYDDVYFVNQ